MKFRGRITEQICIKKFHSIIVSVGKLSKDCVMRLTSEKIFFILCDQSASGGPAVWCDIDQDCYFNEYNIEGVSADQNEIYLQFVPDKMAKALTSLRTCNPRSVKIKLVRKNSGPNLTFDVDIGPALRDRNCVHDIPVVVLPRKMWAEYKEPALPQFDISICLPELKKLRHLMERYRTLGQSVTITAWQRTDTHILLDIASVRVDLRRFNMFLLGEELQPKRVIANIVEREMLHMFFIHDDLVVQYFLPATCKP